MVSDRARASRATWAYLMEAFVFPTILVIYYLSFNVAGRLYKLSTGFFRRPEILLAYEMSDIREATRCLKLHERFSKNF